MKFDNSEPQEALPPGPEFERSIMDSFQQVLQALDDARAELLDGFTPLYGTADASRVPGRRTSVEHPLDGRGRSADSSGSSGAEAAPSHPWRQPGDDWDAFRPRTPMGEARSPRPVAASAVVVEPLWERGTEPDGQAAEDGLPPVGAHHHVIPKPDSSPGNVPAPRESLWSTADGDAVSPFTAGPNCFQWPATPVTSPKPARPKARARRIDVARLVVKPGRLAGVCGVGAVGGLIAVSSLMGNDGEASDPAVSPSVQPNQPLPGGAVWGPDQARSSDESALDPAPDQDVPGAHKHRLRVARILRDRVGGHYDIEIQVQAAAARFQDPSGRA
ncbi:hypothetical protein ACFU5O_20595 [Streptomyces sp. NPDC057445]|uniref:hypothetical protein n=1 Tax=Streptomyces sp. NPDC057445 TaxID=3346136 RepID=UPI0036C358AF